MRKTALLMMSAGLLTGVPTWAQPTNAGGYPGQGAYGAPSGGSDAAIFEVLSRVEQLQSEVQQLRGQVEEQAQTIADLQRKQSNMYSDLDDRMQAISAAHAASPASVAAGGTAAVTTPAVAAPVPQVAVAPTQTPAPTAAPVVEVKPTVAPVVASATAANAGNSAQGNEKDRYQLAYDTLRNGHNQQAIKMFEDLLVDYPAGEFADNAQYWLGEAYKINRDYDKARGAFNKVVNQYGNSTKVPDALLKLGFIESDLQNPAKARDYLTRVITSFPGTTAAHLASKKLATMPQ